MRSEYQLDLPALNPDSAPAASRELLLNAQAAFGFIPNMFRYMAHSPGLLSTYQHGYAYLRNESGFDSVELEAIFLAISREHGCEYCVSAHSLVAEAMSNVPADVLAALRAGARIDDAKLAELVAFTRCMVQTRGLPARAQVEAFLAAGYTQVHLLDVLLAIAIKTISNYSNHLLHTPLDAAFASHAWQDASSLG